MEHKASESIRQDHKDVSQVKEEIMENKVELGGLVKDVVTGFEGIATGKSTWLTGCDQFLLSP